MDCKLAVVAVTQLIEGVWCWLCYESCYPMLGFCIKCLWVWSLKCVCVECGHTLCVYINLTFRLHLASSPGPSGGRGLGTRLVFTKLGILAVLSSLHPGWLVCRKTIFTRPHLGFGLASFAGPTQLSIACSTEKRERAWYLFSCE